jgi:hypothetical protein
MRSLVVTLITTAIILVALSSCASDGKRTTETPEQVLAKAMGEARLPPGKISTLPGADRSDLPYVPVITPPEIARIWIYDHVTPSNDLVVGHWIFVRLKEERWYIEEQWEDSSPLRKKRAALPPPVPAPSNPAAEMQAAQPSPVRTETSGAQSPPAPHGLTPVPQAGQ